MSETAMKRGGEGQAIEAATIMRFRKMLDRIGIHGYYSEMQKEFGDELETAAAPAMKRDQLDTPSAMCAHCDGTGHEPFETSAYPPEPCSECGPQAKADRATAATPTEPPREPQ